MKRRDLDLTVYKISSYCYSKESSLVAYDANLIRYKYIPRKDSWVSCLWDLGVDIEQEISLEEAEKFIIISQLQT